MRMKPLRQQLRYSYDRSQIRGAGSCVCTLPSRKFSVSKRTHMLKTVALYFTKLNLRGRYSSLHAGKS
jgi:hypothetical protein